MTLKIISASGVELEVQTTQVTMPATDGSLGILENHAPLMAALKEGNIRYTVGGENKSFAVTSGVALVKSNTVIILI